MTERCSRKEHDGLVQRRNEAVLAGNLERATPSTNFKVVDSAVAPQRKSSPRRSFFLLAGLLGGAALDVVLGFAREILSQPIHGADELERHLGVAVLSAIPSIENPAHRRQVFLTRLASVLAVVAVYAAVFVLHFVRLA